MTGKIRLLPEFDNHKKIYSLSQFDKNLTGFIAIHRGNGDHPAFGATRLWNYRKKVDALRDALQLSRLMSYKATLAGLPYGGAKGVIIATPSSNSEKWALLKAYAKVVNKLEGTFITGTDVGLTNEDVAFMRRECPYFVGINTNPVRYTVRGLQVAILESLHHRFRHDNLERRSFAIQGLGKIGFGLLQKLYGKVEKIIVTDIKKEILSAVKNKYPNVIIVTPQSIFEQKVDVFAPCALGNILTSTTVQKIQAKIIVGGANNQLQSERVGDILYEREILYAPDFIVNAGGLIGVASEYEHMYNPLKINKRVDQIGNRLGYILDKSKALNVPPFRVATDIAEDIFNTI